MTLRLGYRPPFDLGATLEFLRRRALPGIEVVDATSYSRVITTAGSESGDEPALLRVSAWPGNENAVKLEVAGAPPIRLLGIVDRVRRMFDLDAEPNAIVDALSSSDTLKPIVQSNPGVRLPCGWDGFELAVRAILGQQVSVSAARTMAIRLVARVGTKLTEPLAPGIDSLFPTPDALADADLASIGLTRARADTIRTMARATLDGTVDFNPGWTLEDFVSRWTSLSGIGPWTAHYLALRALGHPNAFPAEDLVLRRAVSPEGSLITTRAMLCAAEAWRPWRAYATIHLWRQR
ncbi:MAG: DNA-3-methyladenine glycosylase [Gemmatimonadales bacterium]